MTCHRLIDRYTAQMERQKLAARIAHAEKTAKHYETRDAGQSRLWVEEAETARAELDGMNTDA